jgi:plastocyanin
VYAGSDTGNSFVDATSHTPETTIQVGDTVQWVNYNGQEHSIVSVNVAPFTILDPPLNGDISGGDPPYTYTFSQPGDFGYRCTIHGGDPKAKTGMWGIVHVRARP